MQFMSFLLIFVTGACRSTFMKRHFGRIDQIWNLKIKLYLQGNASFTLKEPINKFMFIKFGKRCVAQEHNSLTMLTLFKIVKCGK